MCLPLLLLVLSGSAAAQEEPAALPAWAPRWQVGDWWVVRTYQRDLSDRTTSPEPAEGAMPRLPENPRAAPLPDYPPLDGGVPRGYKPGNRFRFEVVERTALSYADDPPGTAPERFWVVRVRTLEGTPVRTADLWFAATDLTLSRVILEPERQEPLTETSGRWTEGTAQLDLPISAELGFPLDWPDLTAAREASAELDREARAPLVQKVKVQGEGTPRAEARLLLEEVTATQEGERRRGLAARTLFTFVAGKPFWTRLASRTYLAEQVESGRKP